jgi:hypothetical protein
MLKFVLLNMRPLAPVGCGKLIPKGGFNSTMYKYDMVSSALAMGTKSTKSLASKGGDSHHYHHLAPTN